MIDLQRDNGAWAILPFWGALVLVFDVMIGGGMRQAVRSESFDTAPGVMPNFVAASFVVVPTIRSSARRCWRSLMVARNNGTSSRNDT